MVGSPISSVQAAMASGQFAFPPIVDVRIDQAKTELVIDRGKAASMGLTMEQLGADMAAILSGNFVNRFSMDGRSYKVIPQVERSARLTPRAADGHPRLGPERPARSRWRGRDACTAASSRASLNRFQQLNAIKISGRPDPVARRRRCAVLEDDGGARSCRPG